MPKPVNAQKSYYVLNPTGNLPATQERLQGFVSKMNWQGVVGQIPRKEDVMEALKSKDMYIFLGHGSGRKYIGTSREFKNLDCHSVCLLMGCSRQVFYLFVVICFCDLVLKFNLKETVLKVEVQSTISCLLTVLVWSDFFG